MNCLPPPDNIEQDGAAEFDFFKSLTKSLSNKLKTDLCQDPEFKNLNINNLIKNSVDTILSSDIDFSSLLYTEKKDEKYKNEYMILNDVYGSSYNNETIRRFKSNLMSRYGQDITENYYVMIEYLKVFKNKNINIIKDMSDLSESQIFNIVYNEVFKPHHTKEDASKWKQKKFRLKKKVVGGVVSKTDDYELIMFNYIKNNMINKMNQDIIDSNSDNSDNDI